MRMTTKSAYRALLNLIFTLLCGMALTACGSDECEADSDCASGRVCSEDGECVRSTDVVPPEICRDDMACGAGEICEAGACRDGCRVNLACPSGEACDREELVCVAIPEGCQDDADCPGGLICEASACTIECVVSEECGSGEVCRDNSCEPCRMDSECGSGEVCNAGTCAPRLIQCTEVGQACSLEAAPGAGFACAQFPGDETPLCYDACTPRLECGLSLLDVNDDGDFYDNTVGLRYFDETSSCPSGSVCQEDMKGQSACRRSQCAGPISGRARCEAIAAGDEASFPDGVNCARILNEVPYLAERGDTGDEDDDLVAEIKSEGFFCEPAGTIPEDGTGCLVDDGSGVIVPRCAEGLICIRSLGIFNVSGQIAGICKRPCTSDTQCPGAQGCIGEDAPSEFGGVGICGERCEPFTIDNDACAGRTKCLAISSADGICPSTPALANSLGAPGPSLAYGSCENDASCPSGTICLNFGGGERRCTPQCDPTLRTREASDAQCDRGDGASFVRAIHLAFGFGAPVDVYLGATKIAEDLVPGSISAAGEWSETASGTYMIGVAPADSTSSADAVARLTVTLGPGEAREIYALGDLEDEAPSLVAVAPRRALPRASADEAIVSVTHLVEGAGPVDLALVARGDDASSLASRVVLGRNVRFGEQQGFELVPTAQYALYAWAAGTVDIAGSPSLASTSPLSLVGGQRAALALSGTPPSLRATPIPFAPYRNSVTRGYCYDLTSGTENPTRPGTGICFQSCDAPANYGVGECVEEIDVCDPFGTNVSRCVPGGSAAIGEQCDDENECAAGSFCDERVEINAAGEGVSSGICRSYCSPPGAPINSSLLGCDAAAGEVCVLNSDINDLGECRLACEPDAPGTFSDQACPTGQRSCYSEVGQPFCHASGTIPLNEQCAGPSESPQNALSCAAGTLCTRDILVPKSNFQVLIDPFLTAGAREVSRCRQLCRPFLGAGQSDCADGFACNPVLPSQEFNRFTGVCLPKVSEVGVGGVRDACAISEVGQLCDDAAFCTLNDTLADPETQMCSGQASCFYLCNPATNVGCPADKQCQNQGSTDFPSLFIGEFGICRDRN